MNYIAIINQLSKNKAVFKDLLSVVDEDMALWKPTPEKWCLLEVVCHLYDEEREDFRARTKHVLEIPTAPLPSINPQGWVTLRNYIGQDYNQKLNCFLNEREQSVQWLNSLKNVNWQNAYEHSKFGDMTAQMFLCNWLAHDYFHIRQINRLKYQYLKYLTSEDLQYAGNW
ncbi:DinB family protein [Galbibacter sp. EGI 63066]|uniref:DinB family protein n=1 Tax=Galbibacter sp. EGI 63066 TaxID=2993559 RepID=UPI0022498C04|nr:DinB family protein [Galbibacter sp. EGI 63066]MCX2679802.1 DinB family protein [Galbibacter sp. EGI 63066]